MGVSGKCYISLVGDERGVKKSRSCVNAWAKPKMNRDALVYWNVLLFVFYFVFMGWSLDQHRRDFVNPGPYVGWWYGQVAVVLTVLLIVSVTLSIVVLLRKRTSKRAMCVLT